MGTQLSPEKKHTAPFHPIFGPCLLWPDVSVWINMPLGTEVNLGLGDVMLDGVAAPRPLKGAQPHSFWSMSIVAKWLDG